MKSVLNKGNIKCRDVEIYLNILGIFFLFCYLVLLMSMIFRKILIFCIKICWRDRYFGKVVVIWKNKNFFLRNSFKSGDGWSI